MSQTRGFAALMRSSVTHHAGGRAVPPHLLPAVGTALTLPLTLLPDMLRLASLVLC